MYLDNNTLVSGSITGNTLTPQTVTGTDTTVLSTNTVDLGVNRDIGAGSDYPKLHALVGTAFSGGTSVEIQAIVADNAALSSNVTVVGSSGAIAVANLTAGARFAVEINERIGSLGKRYLGVRYVTVGAVSAGTMTAFYGLDTQDGQKFYPGGFTVA